MEETKNNKQKISEVWCW